eukprot:6914349-Prymnesium_polylepis.1
MCLWQVPERESGVCSGASGRGAGGRPVPASCWTSLTDEGSPYQSRVLTPVIVPRAASSGFRASASLLSVAVAHGPDGAHAHAHSGMRWPRPLPPAPSARLAASLGGSDL